MEIDDLGERAIALTRELVAIDSRNPSLVPGAPGERRVVEHLHSRLAAQGFTSTIIDADDDVARPSLVALPPASEDRPLVLLQGHLDTVGTDGMDAPFAARVEDDRLFGRGAADMKAGVAAAVVVAEHLANAGGSLRVGLALTADEEDASRGSEAVVAALPGLGVHPVACLIAEPTDLAVARSLRGFAVVRVRFPGRAAHSSQRELGVDAIAHLGRFLAAVDTCAPSVRATGGELMVTVVRGGSSPFVVADAAECVVERRTVPGEPAAGALAEVEALLDPAWGATAELLAHREAWRLDDDGPAAEIAARLRTALATASGTSAPDDLDAPYWMEAPLWQEVCPTLVCGPSGGGLHAVDEWVDLRQLRAFTSALVGALSDPLARVPRRRAG